jgi:hypothetical protein
MEVQSNEVPSMVMNIKKVTVDVYVRLSSSLFNLTETEITVISEIIRFKLNNPDKYEFSTNSKKMILKQLGRTSTTYINNYISILKKKGVIIEMEDSIGTRLKMHKYFDLNILPESILFKLNWKW